MIYLNNSLSRWNSPDFEKVLKTDIESLTGKELPLQAGLQNSSYALDSNIKSTILRYEEKHQAINIVAGIFYSGIIAGCSCTDDPSPTDEITEYCEISIKLDKQTAAADISLINQ